MKMDWILVFIGGVHESHFISIGSHTKTCTEINSQSKVSDWKRSGLTYDYQKMPMYLTY